MSELSAATSPDGHGQGFVSAPLDPLRYDWQSTQPFEVAGMMRDLMPTGVRVLDVGCGTGSLTVIANEGKKNEVLCIEPDPERAELAAKRGLTVYCGLLDSGFIDKHGQFDVIVLSDVIEHLATPAPLLHCVEVGLRPGGIVLASVPNVAHWSLRLGLLFGHFEYDEYGLCDATHLRWYTEASFIRLIKSHGFVIEIVRQTAGTTLQVYGKGLFYRIPRRPKNWIIKSLVQLSPRLFGCQHVVKARKPNAIAPGSCAGATR